MIAELRTKWIEALRSGKYRQSRSALNRDGHLCCLGVLCEVAEMPKRVAYEGDFSFTYDIPGGAVRTSLTAKYLKEIKLDPEEEANLIRMNDGLAQTFPQIADYIEKFIPEDLE